MKTDIKKGKTKGPTKQKYLGKYILIYIFGYINLLTCIIGSFSWNPVRDDGLIQQIFYHRPHDKKLLGKIYFAITPSQKIMTEREPFKMESSSFYYFPNLFPTDNQNKQKNIMITSEQTQCPCNNVTHEPSVRAAYLFHHRRSGCKFLHITKRDIVQSTFYPRLVWMKRK